LKPIVKEIPHILSNSLEVITDLPKLNCSNSTLLVTLDVTSLYPNIPIDESISIILNYIKEQNNPTYPPLCIINTLLSFVLKYNCFNFANLFFLQVHGIAMGTKLAPNYANLFMADFENKHVFTYTIQPTYYRRYIDDILLIWDHSTSELDNFLDHLNSVHPTIKFTKSVSNSQITYLDLDIYRKDTTFETKTHFKSTNTFSYLHGHSNHPPSTFKGVLQGENIRILRNTSEENNYLNTMTFINKQFKFRKYPHKLTEEPSLSFEKRNYYIHKKPTKNTQSCPTFVTTFDPTLSIKNIILEDWPRLSSDLELRKHFPTTPRISYRHSPNLSQLLVRAKLDHHIDSTIPIYSPPTIHSVHFPAKNIPCRHEQCGTCPQLSNKSHFSSFQTKQYHSIPEIFSCDTTHAIYLLDCTICHKQYVGETSTTIRSRMKHHRNMSKTALNRPIYDHIYQHSSNFSIFSITIIDQIKDLQQRKQKEQFYIKLLKTKIPFGLNVISSSNH